MAEPRSADHVAYGQAFREVRGERGLSQERLAGLAGLDRTYVSGIERGERNPSLTNMLRLASTLEVRLHHVATRADLILEDTLAEHAIVGQHALSRALADAAIRLKGLEHMRSPIDRDAARNILYDASRLVAALIDVIQLYEEQTSDDTGVIQQLVSLFDQLTEDWQRYLPPLPDH
jgi:transcriptional regulator with XRE-family HTH domain